LLVNLNNSSLLASNGKKAEKNRYCSYKKFEDERVEKGGRRNHSS
jgi:hypothetical protein